MVKTLGARLRNLDKAYLVLLAMILLYVWIFAGLAFDQHAGMRTHKSDLGQMDQAVWNTGQGRFVEAIRGNEVSRRLTDHVEPIFAVISPVFWLWDDVRALLLLQVVAVALGALPLYALAVRTLAGERSGPTGRPIRLLALAIAAAYLLAPQLQSAVLTEFHAIPLAVPLILWAFWAVEARRWLQFAVAALLVAAVKEEAALLAAGLGAWAMWRTWLQRGTPDRRKGLLAGLLVLLASLAWFYIATFVIVPAFGTRFYDGAQSAYFQRYGPLGDSPLDIVKSFLTQPATVLQIALEPARVRYVLGLLAAFGFLSLAGGEILLLALPVFLANLLSTFAPQYYGEYHYTAPLVPYVAVGAAYGAGRLLRIRPARAFTWAPAVLAAWLLLWAGFSYLQVGRGPLGGRYDPTPVTEHHRLLDRFVDQVPEDAAVTATAAVHPHLSHRRYIYQFPFGLEAPGRADWALLDVTTRTDTAPSDLYAAVQDLLAADWGVVDAADGFLLLRKGHADKVIPDAFYNFVREPSTIDAGESLPGPLVFDGVTVADWPAWRQSRVATHWLVGPEFVPGTVRPWLELRTPAGETLFALDDLIPPALIWYPPQRWQAGERITVETEPLFLPRFWGAAVGVVHGPDPTQPNDRLPVDLVLRQPAAIVTPDGTLALAAAYERDDNGQLVDLPPALATAPDFQAAPIASLAGPVQETTAEFATPAGDPLPLRAWLSRSPVRPDVPLDIWLQWQGPLPKGYQPFVHVRQGETTLAQNDGPPRLFLVYEGKAGPFDDWRQVTLPPDVTGDLAVVVGLFNPTDGSRLEALQLLADGSAQPTGSEVTVGTVTVGRPPIPDQACALVPESCPSQPGGRP